MKHDFSKLNATTDVYGNTLAVGSRVRAFDFPHHSPKSDEITGMGLEGPRVSYIEGIVESIGVESLEGCPRYRITATKAVYTSEHGALIEREYAPGARTIVPPLNGTPIWGDPDRPCFGVVAITDQKSIAA